MKPLSFLAIALAALGPMCSAAPILVSSQPAQGETGVPVTTTVSFHFNTPMNTTSPIMASMPPYLIGTIQWSANVNSSSFSYAWSDDGQTLTCSYVPGFPANAQITWVLNPVGSMLPVTDETGVALPTTTGNFTTAGSGSTNAEPLALYGLTKTLGYQQTSASVVVPFPESPAFFTATVESPSNNPVLSASLLMPGGTAVLTKYPGQQNFSAVSNYASQALLDSAVPAGTYTFQIQRTGRTETPSMTVPSPGSYPPIPQINNFEAAQNLNATQAFTFAWSAFTGAGPNDTIHFFIEDDRSVQVFAAPSPNTPLANTATSITIPAGLLTPGKSYQGILCFTRSFFVASNSPAGFFGSGAMTRTTYFPILASSGNATRPRIGDCGKIPGGFSISVTGITASSVVLETSTNLSTWAPVLTNTPVAGAVTFQHYVPPTVARFYRIKNR